MYVTIPDKSPSEFLDFIEYSIWKLSVNGFINKAGPNHFFSFALKDPIENSNSISLLLL